MITQDLLRGGQCLAAHVLGEEPGQRAVVEKRVQAATRAIAAPGIHRSDVDLHVVDQTFFTVSPGPARLGWSHRARPFPRRFALESRAIAASASFVTCIPRYPQWRPGFG